MLRKITPKEYFADPCPEPSLSASIAKERTPAHAWAKHPKGGGHRGRTTFSMNAGTAFHDLVLCAGSSLHTVDAADWRSKDAQTHRKVIEANGGIAVLRADFEAYKATHAAIAPLLPVDFTKTINEHAAIWKSEGVYCRGLIDAFDPTTGTIYDLKTTQDASEDAIPWTCSKYKYHLQAAAYLEGIETLYPDLVGRVKFKFVFVELEPPFGVRVGVLDGESMAKGAELWKRAKLQWRECLDAGAWPGYPTEEMIIRLPERALQNGF